MGGRVLNATQNVSRDGDIVHIPAAPVVSPVDVTDSTGAFTSGTYTPTGVDLTIDQWRAAPVEITERGSKQSIASAIAQLPQSLGAALAEDIESKILALSSSVTNKAGDGSGNVGQDEVLAAIQTLGQAKLNPMRNADRFTFVFDYSQFAALKKEKMLTDAAYRGTSAGGTESTEIPNIYGIPTFLTNQVASGTDGPASAATKSNMLFERMAFAWAIQSDITYRAQKPSDRLTTVHVAHYLAGFKANLVARASLIPSAA